MTFKNTVRITLIISILTMLSGCYSFSSLKNTPQHSNEITRVLNNQAKLSSFVSSVNLKSDGVTSNVSAGFERRFLGHLQQTNYFSDVIYGIHSKRPEIPYVDLSLNINENIDTNDFGNLVKTFFIGASLYMLVPALPYSNDYNADMTILARWANGNERQYKSACAASSYATYPYRSLVVEFQKGKNQALEKCLNSVINQLTLDKK